MNTNIINSAGKINPPITNARDGRHVNSFAMNKFGDLYLLTDKPGEIQYAQLEINTQSSSDFRILPIDNTYVFENIQFNFSGNMLLLWGSLSAGVLLLQRNESISKSNDSRFTTRFEKIGIEFFDDRNAVLIQARWHPLSGQHVILLFKNGPLAIIDIISGNTHEISLGIKNTNFCSFTFGPNIDWYRFAIILLSETGQIFILSPVIPIGCPIEMETIVELYDWWDDKSSADISSSGQTDKYIDFVQTYLNISFGPLSSINTNTSKNNLLSSSVIIRAGAPFDNTPLTNKQMGIFYRTPALQGPLRFDMVSRDRDTSLCKISSARGQPCDITIMPYNKACDVPVLCVSYTSGDVDIIVIEEEVGPCWQTDTGMESDMMYAPPGLVLVETVMSLDTVVTPEERDRVGYTSLHPDPLLPHALIVSTSSPPRVTSLHILWLQKLLSSSTSAVNAPQSAFNPNVALPTTRSTILFAPQALPSNGTSAHSASPLVGIALSPNVLFGRVALIRSASSLVAGINMTVFEDLHALTMKQQSTSDSNDLSSDLIGEGAAFTALRAVSLQLIAKATKGLNTVPKPSSHGLPQQAPAATLLEVLTQAQTHIEREVIIPMQELHRRTQTRVDIIRDVYSMQVSQVKGDEQQKGLAVRLQAVLDRQLALEAKVTAIKEKVTKQCDFVNYALSAASTIRSHTSRAERQYGAQVQEWSNTEARLGATIATLKRETKRTGKVDLSAGLSTGLSETVTPSKNTHRSVFSHFGSPVSLFRSTPLSFTSPGTPTPTVAPPLRLTDEDISVTKQQMKKQNDILLSTRATLGALEERLAAITSSSSRSV